MIKVISSGIFSSIQDQGRFGYRKWGVPVSGAMDAFSARLSNQLVNNPVEAAVIEMTYSGASLQFLCETLIAITGGDFAPTLNGRSIPLNSPIVIKTGDLLRIGAARYGLRCYLAVSGGIAVAPILGSRSYHPNVAPDYRLQKGQLLPIGESLKKTSHNHAIVRIKKAHFEDPAIPVHEGPEFNLLPKNMQSLLLNTPFTISNESNRMGYRLEMNKTLTAPEIITSAVQPGTVQLTPSGQLIVLMRDCPTTGGYARVLQLTEEGVSRLGQRHSSYISTSSDTSNCSTLRSSCFFLSAR